MSDPNQGRPLIVVKVAAAPFKDLRSRHGDAYNVGAIRVAMDHAGMVGGPLRPIAPEARSEIRSKVAAITA